MKNRTKVKFIIIIMLIVIVVVPAGITFSKYIYDFIGNYLIKTNNFYFNSDKLGDTPISYNVNNWSGVGNFTIQFELNNHKNNLLVSNSDIAYNITLNCPSDVTCSINSSSGIIYTSEMTDNFVVTITPLRVFDAGESINISIVATSSSPYIKTLRANFTITVGRQGIDYEIVDSANQPYMNLTITNVRNQYVVDEAFGDYSSGDIISVDTYKELSDTNKAKCYSARITLIFDPTEVIIDTTSEFLKNSTYTTQTINGVAYISSITFDVEAMSSNILRFYKLDVTEDYTYPFNNSSPVVTFSAL